MDLVKNNLMVVNKKKIIFLRKKLTYWFNKNKRQYPWRNTHDPFKILIAEMMLRRTRADQVKPVYEQLLNEYPDTRALANASSYKLKKILHPLGLKWRISAFKSIARELREKYNSVVPKTREKLTDLPGVGDYVAGAVLSIAYNKNEWIVDSNIVRLFKRYFGIRTSKEGRRDRHVIDIAKVYVSSCNPRKVNLAILDFTAVLCRPKKPICDRCLLNRNCQFIKSQSK